MKRLGCLTGGCLLALLVLILLVILTLMYIARQQAVVMVDLPLSPTNTITSAVPMITDANPLPVAVTIQYGLTPQSTIASQLSSTITPPAPTDSTMPGSAPFFTGQTVQAQQSATVMLLARTAWFGSLTQGAASHLLTLQALGTPVS